MPNPEEHLSGGAPKRGSTENLHRREEIKMGDRTYDTSMDNLPPEEANKQGSVVENFKKSARRTWRELVSGDFRRHKGPGAEPINARADANAARAAEQRADQKQRANEERQDRKQQMREQIRARQEQSRSKGRER